MHTVLRPKQTDRINDRAPMPTCSVECAYYLSLVYSVIGPALGLDIPMLAGGMILIVAAFCILQLRSSAKTVFSPIALLLACLTSFLLIQILIHDESLTEVGIRAFVTWILGLIIVHSLCLRPDFRVRYSIVLFVLGALTVPFLSFNTGPLSMARVDLPVEGGLTHPNGVAGWFGFCAVFFAIAGLESARTSFRIGSWLIAVGCLFIVTLTIERGPLLGTALAIIVGLRRLLRRGFVPVLVLVILAGVIHASGLFEQALAKYSERGMEETGREILWPAAIERIVASPLVGVGESNVLIRLSPSKKVPPHNVFLHFALSSGVIPLAFFIGFWIKAAWRSFSHVGTSDPYRIPYLLFTLTFVMLGDYGLMLPFSLLTVSVVAGSAVSYSKQRPLDGPAHGVPLVSLRSQRSRPGQTIAHGRSR